MLEGLAALACDNPREPAIRRFPELAELHLTTGRPYDVFDAGRLADFLARGFDLPPLERAHEAFVELAECDLHRFFGGWPVLAHEIPRRSHLADPDAHHLVMGPSGIHDDRAIDQRLIDAIAAYGARLGVTRPPRAFLVWLNSD